MIMFIKNKLDIIWYLLGRNDWVWARMSVEARKTILGVNAKFNDQREDYLDSRDYGAGRIAGGENWENQINRMSLLRGRIINGILDKVKPSAVLEIGPGPGFYTKMICEYDSVQKYVGVDVNHYFLQYLQIHLQDLANRRSGFQFSLLSTDVADLSFDNDFDFVNKKLDYEIQGKDESIANQIRENYIKKSVVTVVMIGKDTHNSEWVEKEVKMTLRQKDAAPKRHEFLKLPFFPVQNYSFQKN